MKPCPKCQQLNQDDARFCHQCGAAFAAAEAKEAEPRAVSSLPPPPPQTDADLWKAFIGPNADRYLATFKKFTGPAGEQLFLQWRLPAFFFLPLLWFLFS